MDSCRISIYLGLFLISLSPSVVAQASFPHTEEVGGETSIAPPTQAGDGSLNVFLKAGHVSGHIRNFTMATFNQGALTNYWANATGGAIHYETARIFEHFQLGVKGIFTFNTFSSDLSWVDPLAGKAAKWEVELFDVNHPKEKYDLDRLEELYLKFHFGKGSLIEVGKFDLDQTPLLNRRDGRMKPFVFQGAWSSIHWTENHRTQTGWITQVSPRAMTQFFTIREAVGLQSLGRQPNGTPSVYHEAATTSGIGVVGWHYQARQNWKVQVWEFYLDRLTNINWLQADIQEGPWVGGVQYVVQLPHPFQKGLEYTQRYMQPSEVGHVAAVRLGVRSTTWEVTGNYLHSFNQGRFLWPRELGRERLYTSIPRSWVEGLGNTDVVTLIGRYQRRLPHQNQLSADIRYTSVFTPERTDYSLNKYGTQSYYQINTALKYECFGKLDGLNIQLLYIYRGDYITGDLAPEVIFNKYRMHQLNLITNLNF
ncbi:MAG TPA: hypothetical protein DCE41_11580 [Cytophagales bacterium]|nr:hypothetical protein [Cytophagales bacterium]